MEKRASTWVAMLMVCAGCVPSVSGVARRASSAATDEAVEEATDQESRRRMASLAEDPKIAQATQELIQNTTLGIMQALDSEEGQKRMAAITQRLTDTWVEQLTSSLSSQQTRQRVAALTGTMTDAAMMQVGESLRSELGPAMRDVLREDIGPAMGQTLDEQMNYALGNTAQTVAYRAVLGANDGLGAAWSDTELGSNVKSASAAGFQWLRWGVAALALVALMMLCLAVMAMARARRARADVQRLESATLLLATAMRERHASGETSEIVEIVRTALEDSAASHKRRGLLGALHLRHH
jgi:hypothetical protein